VTPDRRIRFLVLSMAPYRYATRTRKAAVAYRDRGPVTFLSLQGVGRTGKRDSAGTRTTVGASVHQVPPRPPSTAPTVPSLLRSYLPAFGRLVRELGVALYEPTDAGNDSLSNKILECVSTDRPVLAGDLPENRRFVVDNKVGWLTSVTAEDIAESLVARAAKVGRASNCASGRARLRGPSSSSRRGGQIDVTSTDVEDRQ
jgi:hypothetical protein